MLNLRTLVLLCLGLLFANSNLFSQDPNFYIFLCFGQSNMEGQGTIEAQDRTVSSRFKVLEAVDCSNLGRTKGKWYTATPPLCRCFSRLTPADYFGRTLVENLPDSISVGVVNVSVAGCKIELFDKDKYQTYASTVETWMKNIIREYGDNPYGRLVEMAREAQKSGVIKGILMHQGESNTGENSWPGKVKTVYNNLLADLNLNADTVPLLAGEVVHANQGGVCASMNTIIAKLPQTISTAHVVSSDGCTDASDNLHFDSAGYRELGKRYGSKMLSLLGHPINTGIESPGSFAGFSLGENYPNPFSKTTILSFTVPQTDYVSLKVYNVNGIEIAELAGKVFPPGSHSVEYHAGGIPAGIYFYTMNTNQYIMSRKMIVQE